MRAGTLDAAERRDASPRSERRRRVLPDPILPQTRLIWPTSSEASGMESVKFDAGDEVGAVSSLSTAR